MNFTNSVSIGPEFFAKAKNDYGDFSWALIREFMQNSMDCGSDHIDIVAIAADGGTMLSVANNGDTMTREILTGKLLALGGSGKGFQGTVGGFGKAKEVLYFVHNSYEIHTGNLIVQGSGAGYNLVEGEFFDGTRSTIFTDTDITTKLIETIKKFCSYAQWDGNVFLNGEKLGVNLKKGSPRREFEWGTVYTNKSIPNRVIVRVGGIPMFSKWTELNRTVIIELKGASVAVLTSNRDGLLYKYEDEFDEFLNDLVTNRSKALRASSPSYIHFSGAKYKVSKENPERKLGGMNARDLVGDVSPVVAALKNGSSPSDGSVVFVNQDRIGILETPVGVQYTGSEESFEIGPTTRLSAVSEEFILKNETTMKIPDYYQPDSDSFGTYSKKLARIWGRLVLELHRMEGLEQEFAIGFVFSDDCEGQYEKTREYGVVYYLNPAVVVEQASSASKSFKKRFALTERDRLLSIAVHEFVHGLGYDSHNEEYAGKLTDVFARVMKERKRFNWAF